MAAQEELAATGKMDRAAQEVDKAAAGEEAEAAMGRILLLVSLLLQAVLVVLAETAVMAVTAVAAAHLETANRRFLAAPSALPALEEPEVYREMVRQVRRVRAECSVMAPAAT
jgi:hypothetical protein